MRGASQPPSKREGAAKSVLCVVCSWWQGCTCSQVTHTPHTTLCARVWLTTTDLAVTAGKDEEGEGRVEAANVLLVHLLHCNHLLSIGALQVCVCVCVCVCVGVCVCVCVLSLHDAQTWATHGRTRTDKRVGVSSGRVCHACRRVTPVCVCVGVCHKRHECQPTQDMERVTDKRHLDTDRAAEEERRSRRSLAPCPECSSGAPCVPRQSTHRERWAR
jgi:hypothetical protein